MDRVDFLDFTLLTRDISGLDRYSTRQLRQGLKDEAGEFKGSMPGFARPDGLSDCIEFGFIERETTPDR